MALTSLNSAVTGFQANQFRLDTVANNVANVNTDNFRSRQVSTTDQPYQNGIGQGTRVSATPESQGPSSPLSLTELYAGPQGGQANVMAATPETPAAAAYASDTDLAREMTNMMEARTAYAANAVAGRTADQMSQTVVDINV
ncbi:MAG: flagellar basal body protein [Planctomycetota bacterium]|jgi:flagellar hook protein FlgE|nr:flagellar basal body protein [Planctomycetota bacterium]